MRSIVLTSAVLAVCISAGEALAGPDSDALAKFGMEGTFAVDCAQPPGPRNPYLTYTVSPRGGVTRTLKMDPSLDGSFSMRNLRLLANDRLQYQETGRQAEFTVIIARIGGRIRSWESVRGDGQAMIRDGLFTGSGQPTPAFEKCASAR
ncbi:MAG: hypothetical protein F9K29_00975 [Hyphomicrobiaceae bacterium]|nr:MAG: hypothetical protein F9K29_00975 [Hyphomicrobiaceae bacterium]